VLRGKVRYMSPEHARGSRLDRRADVWSLGVTLLEVTTGTTPFAGEHDVATLVQLLSAEPTIPDHPRLPPCVKAIVERALRRLPEERYPTAREMGTAIETAIATLGEKITRRGVARVVRLRLGTTKTEALPAPSFYGEEDEEDVAPTALLKSPLRAPSPEALRRSEENTREATPPAHVIPSPARGFAPPASAARSNGRFDEPRVGPLPGSENEELTDEELTNVRSIDVVMPTSAPSRDARPEGAPVGSTPVTTPPPSSRPSTVPLPIAAPAPTPVPPPAAVSVPAPAPRARPASPMRHDAPTFKIERPGRGRRAIPFVFVTAALSVGIGVAGFVVGGSKSSATPPIASAAAPSAAPAESESEAIAIVAPEPPPTASAAPDASASARATKAPPGHPNLKKKKK
jgi:serine/threonine-protein kinase